MRKRMVRIQNIKLQKKSIFQRKIIDKNKIIRKKYKQSEDNLNFASIFNSMNFNVLNFREKAQKLNEDPTQQIDLFKRRLNRLNVESSKRKIKLGRYSSNMGASFSGLSKKERPDSKTSALEMEKYSWI